MLDDTTSEATARFVEHDSTEENLGMLGSYVKTNGRPLAVYRQSQSVSDGCQGSTHPQAPAEQPTQIDKRHAEPTAPAPIIPTFISVLLLHCF